MKMNDRYLFRAKRVGNGEWETGSLTIYPEKWAIENACKNPPDSDPMWRKILITHDVDPSTICQCTGYKGIYEHDIFQCDDNVYEIIWSDYSLEWEAVSINSSESIPLGEFSLSEINVIGNSIDNPELLESEE